MSPNWKYEIISNSSELSLSTDSLTDYLNNNRKDADLTSLRSLLELSYNPYVIGDKYNSEYDKIKEKCPYDNTASLLSLQLEINRYIINDKLSIELSSSDLMTLFLNSYHLKKDTLVEVCCYYY